MPRWTQKMAMHLNGGSKFSQLNFDVFRDGKPTGIVRVKRTDGSHSYRITMDVLHCGDDQFDILATGGEGMEAWLAAHAT